MQKTYWKRLSKFFILAVLFLIVFVVNSSTSSANSFSGGRSGSGYHYAYYDSSVIQRGYEKYFNDARTYWNQSPKVGIGRTFTYRNEDDRYYVNAARDLNVLGEIYIAKYINGVPQYKQDDWINHYWDFTHVVLYYNSIQSSSANTHSKVSWIASHEVGHSIKMAHNNSNGSVLRTPYQNYLIPGGSGNITISTVDLSNANAKWQ